MAIRTIDRFYPTYTEAVEIVADLIAAGIPATDVSVIESEMDARLPHEVVTDTAQSPAITGGTIGAAIGAGIGALDGVGSIAIPFTDPLVATGWVLPCVVFAVIFGIIGAIVGTVTKLGVSNKQAHTLASGLQQGKHLVLVRVDEAYVPLVESVFARERPIVRGQVPDPVASEDVRPVPLTVGEETETAYRE